jgi:hypothetical protein
MDYSAWTTRSDAEVTAADLGELNLAAADGLPGSEGLDVRESLSRLDAWSDLVRVDAKRAARLRGAHRDLSDGQFAMLAMVTVLQRTLGVHYNPECMSGPYDASDSRNHFIHGPLSGHGGTCSSLPVLYAAIGRRLGYPLWLVAAKDHRFVRWESTDGERFNIETTSRGFVTKNDDCYHRFPLPLTAEDIARGSMLRNLSPREEVAMCLGQRALCLQDSLRFSSALEASYHAAQLDPVRYGGNWKIATVMCKIARNLSSLNGDNTPISRAVRWCTPPPSQPWEKWATPIAQRELTRIFRLQATKRGSGGGKTVPPFDPNPEGEIPCTIPRSASS